MSPGLAAASTATAIGGLASIGVVLYAMRSARMLANEPFVAWVESVAIVLLVIGAWLAVRRPPLATACAVAAAGAGVPVLAGASAAPALATTLGIGLAPLSVAAAAAVAIEYADLADRRARVVLWAVAGTASALVALTIDPIDEAACLRRCPDVPAPLSDIADSALTVAFGAGASVACLAIAVVMMLRRAGRPSSVVAPAVLAALAAGALATVGQALRAVNWGHIGGWPWAAAIFATGSALLGATVVVERLGRIRTTTEIRRLAERLSVGGAGRAVFPALDDGGWLDVDGLPVTDASEFRTEIADELGVIARLALGRRERSLPAADLDPADLLAIRNARMTASALARVRWLEESRRLVVASTERERERVEHDLHDGAQQRLVSALLFLAVARRELGDSDALTEAESQIRIALERLRELSHGPDPHDGEDGRRT